MRQIKFRGKRVDNGEWVYGYYGVHQINHGIWSRNGNEFPEWHQIYQESLGQFTGLLDKNGKEAFEMDVTKDKRGKLCKIVWVDEYACFALETIDEIVAGEYNFCLSDIDIIIGNLHDSPSLTNH